MEYLHQTELPVMRMVMVQAQRSPKLSSGDSVLIDTWGRRGLEIQSRKNKKRAKVYLGIDNSLILRIVPQCT